jgi:hypothetical protein
VLLGTAALVMDGGPDRDQVAVSPAGRSTGAAAQLPRTVEVRCTPDGIEIPVASVRPRQDGLHLRVINELAAPTQVRVKGNGWDSGSVPVEPGLSALRQPVPPGTLRIGCRIEGRNQQRTVELVDVYDYYQRPELSCPSDERSKVPAREGPEPNKSMSATTIEFLTSEGYPVEELAWGPVRGYVSQRLGDPTVDPKVQVNRDGETVAFVHLRRAGDRAEAPWAATVIEGCDSFLAERSTTDTTTGTTSTDTTSTDTTVAPGG